MEGHARRTGRILWKEKELRSSQAKQLVPAVMTFPGQGAEDKQTQSHAGGEGP